MDRTITANKIFVNNNGLKGSTININVREELKKLLDGILKLPNKATNEDKKKIKHELTKSKKIVYLEASTCFEEYDTYCLLFKSAKYDHVREVMDTNTMTVKGKLKKKPDGDLERTHAAIKFINKKEIYFLCESNKDGVTANAIIEYLNTFLEKMYALDGKEISYHFYANPIISTDFIKSLEGLKSVNAVTLTVDEENVAISGFAELAGRGDIKKDFEIVLKPTTTKKGIKKDTVKEFFKEYSRTDRKVKCITIAGNGSSIKFDTEQMKRKFNVKNIELEVGTNEVKTDSIFVILNNFMLELEKGGE